MFTKEIVHTKDEEGRPVVAVPLGPRGRHGYAVLYEEDFSLLEYLGVSPNWNINGGGYVICNASGAPGGKVQVARVLLDAGQGQQVTFINHNKADLRRNNLRLVEGYAQRRDREFIKPKEIKHVRA